MATTFYFRDIDSDINAAGLKLLGSLRGGKSTTAVTNTTPGGFNIPVTQTASGQAIAWMSEPIAAVTIAGSITVNHRGRESATSVNACPAVTVERCDGSGNVISALCVTAIGTGGEYTTSDAALSRSTTPTSRTFADGDRIKITLLDTNVGTMGTGTTTRTYCGPTAAAAGDCYVTFTETITQYVPTSGIFLYDDVPAVVLATGTTATSVSFTPPANSLLVALCVAGNGSGATGTAVGTCSDSVGSTWTRLKGQTASGEALAEIWVADAGASPAARTTSFTATVSTASTSLAILVVGNAATRGNQTGATAGSSGTSYSQAITTTVAGSLPVGAVGRGTSSVTMAALSPSRLIEVWNDPAGDSSGFFFGPVTGTPGSVTLGFNNVAAATNEKALAEILPAVAGGAAKAEAGSAGILTAVSATLSGPVTETGSAGVLTTASGTITVTPADGAPVTLTAGTPFQATTSVTSGTVTLPSGLTTSDYTFLFCTLNATTGVITGPAGWSTAFASAQSTASTSHAMAVYYRKWVGGDTDPVVTCTSGRLAVLPVKVSGADGTTPIEGTVASTTQASATTAVDAPSQTPTASTLLVTTHSGRSAASGVFITWTPPSGMTEVGEAGGQAAAATNASIEVASLNIGAGATGAKTATADSTATGSRGISMLLAAAVTAVAGSAAVATSVVGAVSVDRPVDSSAAVTTTLSGAVSVVAASSVPTFVQQATARTTVGTAITATFGAAPTSGNLLVLVLGGDKNTGALTLAGWTQVHVLTSASVSLYVAWKVSDGSETSVTATTAVSAPNGSTVWVGEYTAAAVPTGTWTILGSASGITNELTTLTQASGTTGAVAQTGLGIACLAIDSSTNMTTAAWSNSYASRYTATGFSSSSAVAVAEGTVTSGATTSSTVTITGTADQVSAAVTVFAKVASGIALVGSASGTTVLTAAASVDRPVAGSAAVATTATGAAVEDAQLAATSALTIALTGAAVGAVALAGSADVTTSAAGTPAEAAPLAGTSAVTIALTGAPVEAGALDGTVTVVTSVVGAAVATAALAGNVVVSTSAAGAVSADRPVAGTASGATTAFASAILDRTVTASTAVTVGNAAALARTSGQAGSAALTTAAAATLAAAVAVAGGTAVTVSTAAAPVAARSEAGATSLTFGTVATAVVTSPMGLAGSASLTTTIAGNLTASFVLSNAGPNTLVNGDYETALNGAEFASYFAGTYTRDTTEAYTGTASLKLATNSAVNPQGYTHYSPVGTSFPAGTVMRAAFWVKGPNGTGITLSRRAVQPANTSDLAVSGFGAEASIANVTLTGVWQRVAVPNWTYLGATFKPALSIRLTTAASGVAFYVDQIETGSSGVGLTTVATATPSKSVPVAGGTGITVATTAAQVEDHVLSTSSSCTVTVSGALVGTFPLSSAAALVTVVSGSLSRANEKLQLASAALLTGVSGGLTLNEGQFGDLTCAVTPTGAIAVAQLLTGSSTGSLSASGNVGTARPLAALVGLTAAVIGATERSVAVVGVAGMAIGTVGSLVNEQPLTAAIVLTAGVSGALGNELAVVGVCLLSIVGAATITVDRSLDATLTVTLTVSGTVPVTEHPAAGVVSASWTATGALSSARPLDGFVPFSTTLTCVLQLELEIDGTSALVWQVSDANLFNGRVGAYLALVWNTVRYRRTPEPRQMEPTDVSSSKLHTTEPRQMVPTDASSSMAEIVCTMVATGQEGSY